MPKRLWIVAIAGVFLVASAPALGQYTLITDFEGTWSYPVNTPDCEVIFLNPGNASTTEMYVDKPAGEDSFVGSSTGLPGLVVPTSGTQASTNYWVWKDASQHQAWIRLQTTNTSDIPNPALHLDGKVRFYLGGTAYTDGGLSSEVSGAQLYLGLGIRETGTGTPLGQNAGISGDVEWVGVDRLSEILAGTNGFCDTIVDPESDDVQVLAPGTAAPEDGVCVDGGTNGLIDSDTLVDDFMATTPRGLTLVPLDRTMRQYEFDLPALDAAGSVFGFTGDGSLGASPNNRGSLEHLALTNHPDNAGINANFMLVWIDDVEFYAPVPNPPVIVTIPDPPRPMDTAGVLVSFVDANADSVELFIRGNGDDPDYLLGSVTDPAGGDVLIPTAVPLPYGVFLYARQTVDGLVSDNSEAVLVASPGNAPLRLSMAVRETDAYDHDLSCGDDGTGFDSSQPSNLEWIAATDHGGTWGTPEGGKRLIPSFDWQEVTFNPCVDNVTSFSGNGELYINTTGVIHTNSVWEGLYYRIDEFTPAVGPYVLYLDDMKVVNGGGEGVDCVVDDFESYEIAEYIAEGEVSGDPAAGVAATAAQGDDVQIVSVGAATFLGQKIVGPGPNGVLDTEPSDGEYTSAIHARFSTPGGAGTNVGVAIEPRVSAVTDEASYSGTQSLKVEWAFINATNSNNHLRLTTNGSTATNPPETFLNPDPVIPLSLDGTYCDGVGDIYFSVMMKLEPNPIMGDSDGDLDVDLADYAAFQECYTMTTLSAECDAVFDYFEDDSLDADDFLMFQLSMAGPN